MPGRVHTRREFALFAAPTGRGQSGPLRVAFAAEPSDCVNVAFAIGRKVGNAVVRNRIRRRLRALIDDTTPPPKSGYYLIRCGTETGNLSYEQLHDHLTRALVRSGAL